LVRPARLAAAGKGAEPRFWFQHALVGVEVGPTGAQFSNSDTRYCARFDGAEVVRRVYDLAQYIYLREKLQDPLMRFIYWNGKAYAETSASPPNHRFGVQFSTYCTLK